MSAQPILTPLDGVREHLAGRDLPEIVSMSVTTTREVTMQISSRGSRLQDSGLATVAGQLVAWAESLTGVSVAAWRPPGDEGTVHLSVRGLLGGGVPVEVYAGVPFALDGPGGGLESGASTSLTLGALRDACEGAR